MLSVLLPAVQLLVTIAAECAAAVGTARTFRSSPCLRCAYCSLVWHCRTQAPHPQVLANVEPPHTFVRPLSHFVLPQETELRKLITPDQVSAYESGVAANTRLAAMGLCNLRWFSLINPTLLKLATDMVRRAAWNRLLLFIFYRCCHVWGCPGCLASAALFALAGPC